MKQIENIKRILKEDGKKNIDEIIKNVRELLETKNGSELLSELMRSKPFRRISALLLAIIMAYLDAFALCDFIKSTVMGGNIYMTNIQFGFNIITSTMLIICVISTIISGIDYLKNGKKLILKAL